MHICCAVLKGLGPYASFANPEFYLINGTDDFLGMVEIQLPTDPTFIPEIWIEYGIGVCVIFLRSCIRIRTAGFRGFQGDDYLTILVWTGLSRQNHHFPLLIAQKVVALYTMDQTLVHFVCTWCSFAPANPVSCLQAQDMTGTILEIPPDVANKLSPSQAATFIHGSKCELAAWYSYTGLIWVLKASMLFF